MRSLALAVTLLAAVDAPAQFVSALATVGRAGANAGRAGAAASHSGRAIHAVPHGGVTSGTGSSDALEMLAGLLIALGGLLSVGVAVAKYAGQAQPTAPVEVAPTRVSTDFIRVTGLPPGEAPEDIRRAWVGLRLPLHLVAPAPRTVVGNGVLTGEAANLTHGYFVDAAEAVAALATTRPDAAAWWRANTPHLFAPGRYLMFPAEVCEPTL